METMLLQISGAALLNAIIYIIIGGLIFWLLWWLISYIAIPEPFNKVVRVILGVVAVLFLINILLGLIGSPMFKF